MKEGAMKLRLNTDNNKKMTECILFVGVVSFWCTFFDIKGVIFSVFKAERRADG